MKQDELVPGKYYTWPGAPSDENGYLFVGLNKEGRAVFDYETLYHTAKSLDVDYKLVPQETTMWINMYKDCTSVTMYPTKEYAIRRINTKSFNFLGTFPFTYRE